MSNQQILETSLTQVFDFVNIFLKKDKHTVMIEYSCKQQLKG